MESYKKLLMELRNAFRKEAKADRASQKQAYLKTSMPFWGLVKPEIDTITKTMLPKYPPHDNEEYRATVNYLFLNATHREEWYAAINYARLYKKFIIVDNVDIYLDIVLQSQWWDIVDTVADHLVGKALFKNNALGDYLTVWINHENMWVRRTAIIAQLKYKKLTDFDLLATLIQQTAHEKEFFIRKAIGWALREYSKTNKDAVKVFIENNKSILQPLSIREGSKYI